MYQANLRFVAPFSIAFFPTNSICITSIIITKQPQKNLRLLREFGIHHSLIYARSDASTSVTIWNA